MSLHELSPESTNQLETSRTHRRSLNALGKASVVRALYDARRTERDEEIRQRTPITNPAYEEDRATIVNEAIEARRIALGTTSLDSIYVFSAPTNGRIHETPELA